MCVVSGVWYAGEVERVEVIVGPLTVLVVGTMVVVEVVVVRLIVELNFPSSGRVVVARDVSSTVMKKGSNVVEIAGTVELSVDPEELVVSAVVPTRLLGDAEVTLMVVCGTNISDVTEGVCGAEGDVRTLLGRSGLEVLGGWLVEMPVVVVVDAVACVVCEAEVGCVVGE